MLPPDSTRNAASLRPAGPRAMCGFLDPGYFAVVHPTRNVMTYWRVGPDEAHPLRPWPPRSRYLVRTPPSTYGPERDQWDHDQTAFYEQIYDTMCDDPDGCRARFAALTTRCVVCGRTLREARSKVEGIGPDCRKDFSDEQIEAFAQRVAAAHQLTIEVA